MSKNLSMSTGQRQWVVQFQKENSSATQKDIANAFSDIYGFKPSQSALSRTLKRGKEQDNMQEQAVQNLDSKRAKSLSFPNMEGALIEWFLVNQEKLPMNGDLIKEKGKFFLNELYPGATFEFSNGWLSKFKKRHGIRNYRQHGESGSVNRQMLEDALPVLKALLNNFNWEDIYNMDETGLCYMMSGDAALSTRQLEGRKKYKQRLSIAVCCNGDGTDKLPLWVIGNAENPRCFKNIKKENLGVIYKSNSKAWMTAAIFQEWLRAFDAKMHGRKVVLLLDNCPGHKIDGIELRNTTVHFLPPNTTSKIQPCDAGIIRTFKAFYKKRYVRSVATGYDLLLENPDKINVLQAIQMIRSAWHTDVKPETIRNCFHHCEIKDIAPDPSEDLEIGNNQMEEAINELAVALNDMNYRNPMDINRFLNHEEEREVMELPTDMDIIELWKVEPNGNDRAIDIENDDISPLITVTQAKRCLKDLQQFAIFGEGCGLDILQAIDSFEKLIELRQSTQKQRTLHDYFQINN